MILFVQKVFEGFVSGTDTVVVDAMYAELLASADQLAVHASIDQISGTSPSILVTSLHSNDGLDYYPPGAAEINMGLTPGQPASAIASSPAGVSLGAYVSYGIILGDNVGSTPRAHVRLIVCGRGSYPVNVRVPLDPKP